MREPLMQNQSTWLAPAEPIETVRLEILKKDLPKLPFWKSEIEIPKLNTTTEKIETQEKLEGKAIVRPAWWKLYEDREAFEAILEWAGSDFERFGYSKDIKCQ